MKIAIVLNYSGPSIIFLKELCGSVKFKGDMENPQ
jgi:hypothetical protein